MSLKLNIYRKWEESRTNHILGVVAGKLDKNMLDSLQLR